MTERGFRVAEDGTFEAPEQSLFPILCETCLGDNPYVRMTRGHMDKECKICQRPYTAFRWQPGRKARFKNTIICQFCAKMKNVCQTCLFDLEYGLPVQVRDKFLEDQEKYDVPTSRVNRDYMINNMDKDKTLTNISGSFTGGSPSVSSHPVLQRLSRHTPYYERNKSRVCTFWAKGECSRGVSCPFRHEYDKHDPELSGQKIKDRYMGVDDPVARKILRRGEEICPPS